MQAQVQQGEEKSNQKHAEKNKPGKGDSTPALDEKTWVAKICNDDEVEEAKAIDYTPFTKPVNIGLTTDGASTKAFGSGPLHVRFFPPNSSPVKIPITKAYYAPGIMSLISISHLDNLGQRIQFYNKRIDIWHGDDLELSIPRVGNSYKCQGEVILPDTASAANATKSTHDHWHQRYGHIGHSMPRKKKSLQARNIYEDEKW
ncbi:hypothetical protein FRC00_001925 [Tulasnella sp. 408]|nr:hypothetical protein FRC00_001925 [Tulasnella sp. 408]